MDLLNEEKYGEAKTSLEAELTARLNDLKRSRKPANDRESWLQLELLRANSVVAALGHELLGGGPGAREAWAAFQPHAVRLAMSSTPDYRSVAVSVSADALLWNFRTSGDPRVTEACVDVLQTAVGPDVIEDFDAEDLGSKFSRLLNDPDGDDDVRWLAAVLFVNHALMPCPVDEELERRMKFVLQNPPRRSGGVFNLLETPENGKLACFCRLISAISSGEGAVVEDDGSTLAVILKIQRGEVLRTPDVQEYQNCMIRMCLKAVSVLARREAGEQALARDCLRRILDAPPSDVLPEITLVAAYCTATALRKKAAKFASALEGVEQLFEEYFAQKDSVAPVSGVEERFLRLVLCPWTSDAASWSASFLYVRAHACFEAGDISTSSRLYAALLDGPDFCGSNSLLPAHRRLLVFEYGCLLLLSGDVGNFHLVETMLGDDRDLFSALFVALSDLVSAGDVKRLERVGRRFLDSDVFGNDESELLASALVVLSNACAAKTGKLTRWTYKFLRRALTLSERNVVALNLVSRSMAGDLFVPDEEACRNAARSASCEFCDLTRVPPVFLAAENRERLKKVRNLGAMLAEVARRVDFGAFL